MSNLAFQQASDWGGWDGSAGCLPYALETIDSFLGAMRNTETKEDEVGRERSTHNRNPRCAGMVLKLIVTHGRRRNWPKSKTLASKTQSKALNLLQCPQKSLISNWIGRILEEPEEMGEKTKHKSLFKSSASTNRLTGPSSVDRLVNKSTGLTFHLLCIFSFSDPPAPFLYHFQLKSPIFYAQCQGNFYFWSKFDHLSKYMSIWCI